jgi:peptidyl-prolyl cis-trans isomerase C
MSGVYYYNYPFKLIFMSIKEQNFMNYLLRIIFVSFISLGVVFSSAAIAAEKAPSTNAAATVNGTAISEKEFGQSLNFVKQRSAMQGQEIPDEQLPGIKKNILENLINTELLYQAATKEKVTIDETKLETQWSRVEQRMKENAEYRKNIEQMNMSADEMKDQMKRQMMIEQFVTDRFVNTVTISEEEITAYYDGNKKMFHTPQQVKASHILIKVDEKENGKSQAEAKKQIEDIQKQIKDGTDFADLAEKHSQCPSSKKGGDLGYFGRGQMVKPFEDTAFGMKEGDISDVVTTQFGYHLIKVTGKKDESTIPADEASPRISSFLKQQKTQQDVGAFLKSEKEKATITRKY